MVTIVMRLSYTKVESSNKVLKIRLFFFEKVRCLKRANILNWSTPNKQLMSFPYNSNIIPLGCQISQRYRFDRKLKARHKNIPLVNKP